MVNVCRAILQHIKEYCEEAAIHGPQHIVAHRLAIFERFVPIQLACTVYDYFCHEKIIAKLEALITYFSFWGIYRYLGWNHLQVNNEITFDKSKLKSQCIWQKRLDSLIEIIQDYQVTIWVKMRDLDIFYA